MGRPLGIRSKPYAAINTTDQDQGGVNNNNNNNDLPPISPTIYQDDSGLSFEKDDDDEEGYAGQNYGDEVYEEVHEDDYDAEADDDIIATQSLDLQHQLDTTESQSNERSFRVKFVLLFSFLAAMVIFGKEYYNSNGGGGDSKIISTEFTTEEYNGVRGKTSPQDKSSASMTVGGNEEEGICQDDPDFIYHNVQKDSQFTCAEYVGSTDKAGLLRSRCRRSTGIRSSEDDTVELMIQDFCKMSCGLCGGGDNKEWGDDFTEEEKEIIKEQIVKEVDEGMLEVLEEVDKLTSTTVGEGGVPEIDGEEIMNAEEVLAELEADLEEDEEFLIEDHNDIAEKIASAKADDDGVLEDEKEEYISELAEELQEDSEIEEGVEGLEEELELVEELEEELEEVEYLYEDNEVEEDASDEDSSSAGAIDDISDYYFTPLTPDERDQMKGKLRNTLLQTKNALRMSASFESRMAVTDTQRTLMLSTTFPKQFMHMHHMKTGGTSVDGLIRCALNRQKELHNGTSINYGRMSECGSGVQSCMKTLASKLDATLSNNVFYRNDAPFDPADETDISVDDMNVCKSSESNVMSYCASLHAVRTFGWKNVDKITVIRNPIDRAWSMYRFTLTRCYNCQQLKDVLKQILNGTFVASHGKKANEEDNKEVVPNFLYEPNNSCAVQLIGHQSTNLLSSVDLYNIANDVRFPMDADIVHEAIKNLREDFTWIGLTDRIQESVEGFRQIFPFLAENLNNATKVIQEEFQSRGEELEDNTFALPTGYSDEKSCPFEHRNAGHDPTCGTTELDDETKEMIMKLNNRDMAVYKAAVERFELQMEVLQEYKDGKL
mmetsp:Transcript_15740/g.22381  ORF Transcript_15740/g.22381 Transcript_15740/m.22381 type:complete len:831 (+) Transcript_15740:30-2522(+)